MPRRWIVVVVLVVGCGDNLATMGKLGNSSTGLGMACGNSCECAAPYVCLDGVCGFPAVKTCTPNVKACVGEFVGTCRPDGSALEVDPAPCPERCFQGACRAGFCEPAEVYCIGDRELTCNEWGLGWDVTGTCSTDGGAP